MRAIIVGAGIGGLTTALFLNKHGIDCEVFEQAAAIQQLGLGINLMPQAIASFDEIGLLRVLEQSGIAPDHLFYRTGQGLTGVGRAARTARGPAVSANLDPSQPAAAPALRRLRSTSSRWRSCRSPLCPGTKQTARSKHRAQTRSSGRDRSARIGTGVDGSRRCAAA